MESRELSDKEHRQIVNIIMITVNIVSTFEYINVLCYKCTKYIVLTKGVYMKKVITKFWGVFLAMVMIGSLAACGNSEPTQEKTDSEKKEASKTNGAADEKAETIEIDLWAIASAGDDKASAAIENAINTIEAERPDIKINLSTSDGDAYKTKIKTAVAANEMPDIFYTWLPGYSKGFVDSGSILKLDDYLSQDAMDNLNMGAVRSGNGAYDGIYALPVEVKMGVLYCNSALFEEHGIKIPDTYDELLTAVEQFNAVGIQPLLAPGKRIWPVMWLYDILAVQTVGADAAISALKKDTSFDQQGFMDAALKIRELADANTFVEGAIGLDNPEADAEFMNGNAPMYFMGSWAAPAFSDPKNPVADSLVVKRFPGVGNGHDKDMLGGTGDGYMVSSGTEHKEEAVWVVERFTKLLCESDGSLFPVWNVEKDYSGMAPVFTDLYDLYSDSEGFVIWWDTYMDGDDAQTHKNLALELFAGVKTPEEYMEGMTAISNKK